MCRGHLKELEPNIRFCRYQMERDGSSQVSVRHAGDRGPKEALWRYLYAGIGYVIGGVHGGVTKPSRQNYAGAVWCPTPRRASCSLTAMPAVLV